MRISVLGIGYVGAVSCGCLADSGHDVIGVDVSADKVAMIRDGRSPIVEEEIDRLIADAVARGSLTATEDVAAAVLNTDVSFISVGTPSAPDGSLSMRAIDEVAMQVGQAMRQKSGRHVVVMRSTVPPGTAEDRVIPILERESGRKCGQGFSYYSNPEFLREGSSVRDFHAPPFTLIGAAEGDDAAVLREIYAPIKAAFHVAPYRISESVKYLCNVFHAVKLGFANEAGAVLKAHGVDAREVLRLFCEDRVLNISPAYLKPGFAFGGSCLPKDVRSFLSLASSKHVETPFLGKLLASNESIIENAFEMVMRQGRHKVSLFGLAFKPGTDDLRESPFVILAEKLLGKGFNLGIYDRSVQVARLTGSNRAYIDREIPHLERLIIDGLREAVEGCRIAIIGHVDAIDRATLVDSLTDQIVIDLAGITELRNRQGIIYHGLCW